MLISLCLKAQQPIKGRLLDDEGKALAFATVKLYPTAYITSTDREGQFQFDQVAPGDYEIRISAIGFEELRQKVSVSSEHLILQDFQLTTSTRLLDQVVVTASRLEQTIGDVPIPIAIIDNEQITRSGNLRLDEVLREQTGLNISSDHGTGIQVQGLDSDYVLILVDGEPLIGRTAGTFDLSRAVSYTHLTLPTNREVLF